MEFVGIHFSKIKCRSTGDRKIEDSHLILFESASRKITSEKESRIQMKFERCRLLCAFEQCIVMQCMFALKVRMQKCIFSLMDLVPQTPYVCLISGESLIYVCLTYNAKLVEINLNKNFSY